LLRSQVEATVNLHKRLHGVTFKKRAPRAVREIKAFALTLLGTSNVMVETEVNKAVWSKGIRNVPRRVRLSFKREKDGESNAMKTTVSFVAAEKFKGMHTTKE